MIILDKNISPEELISLYKPEELLEFAMSISKNGDAKGALVFCGRVLQTYNARGDIRGRSIILYSLAQIASSQGNFKIALGALTEMLSITENQSNRQGQIEILILLADVYLATGEANNAQECVSKAIKISNDNEGKIDQSYSVGKLGYFFIQQGDWEKGKAYYGHALELTQTLNNIKGRGNILEAMGLIYQSTNDEALALSFYQKAFEVKSALGDRVGMLSTLLAMAIIFQNNNDFEKAMQYCQQSLTLAEKIDDRPSKIHALSILGHLARENKNYELSIEYSQQLLKLHKESKDFQEIVSVLGFIATNYLELGQSDNALETYKDILALDENLKNSKSVEAIAFSMMGKALWKNEKYKQAIENVLAGLKLLSRMGIEPDKQQAMSNDLLTWRRQIGKAQFLKYWKEITGNADLPGWLDRESETHTGDRTLEEIILGAIHATRSKAPDIQRRFERAYLIATSPKLSPDLHVLGKVLMQILDGNFAPDLSELHPDLAWMIKYALTEDEKTQEYIQDRKNVSYPVDMDIQSLLGDIDDYELAAANLAKITKQYENQNKTAKSMLRFMRMASRVIR